MATRFGYSGTSLKGARHGVNVADESKVYIHNIHHVFELENGHAFWLLWYFSKRSSTWRQCC